MQNVHIGDLSASKVMIASEYPDACGACGPDSGLSRSPNAGGSGGSGGTSTTTASSTGSISTTSSAPDRCEEGGLVWDAMADGHSCGGRIQWVMQNVHIGDLSASKAMVASEYPAACGACGPDGGISRRLNSKSIGSLRGSAARVS